MLDDFLCEIQCEDFEEFYLEIIENENLINLEE